MAANGGWDQLTTLSGWRDQELNDVVSKLEESHNDWWRNSQNRPDNTMLVLPKADRSGKEKIEYIKHLWESLGKMYGDADRHLAEHLPEPVVCEAKTDGVSVHRVVGTTGDDNEDDGLNQLGGVDAMLQHIQDNGQRVADTEACKVPGTEHSGTVEKQC